VHGILLGEDVTAPRSDEPETLCLPLLMKSSCTRPDPMARHTDSLSFMRATVWKALLLA